MAAARDGLNSHKGSSGGSTVETAAVAAVVLVDNGWGFSDIRNNQGRGKCYQPSWRPRPPLFCFTLRRAKPRKEDLKIMPVSFPPKSTRNWLMSWKKKLSLSGRYVFALCHPNFKIKYMDRGWTRCAQRSHANARGVSFRRDLAPEPEPEPAPGPRRNLNQVD